MSFGVDEIPRPTRSPRRPAGENTRLPTGLEALFGWLYLQGRTERLNQLFEVMMGEE